MPRYIITDLEATCWDRRTPVEGMETIEIGAVALKSATGPAASEFSSFVKPIASPELSEFCKKLTSISQEDVDRADHFSLVFPRFMEWIGGEPFFFCTWGAYDLGQLKADCNRFNMPFPNSLERHINLKREFARLNHAKPMGMEKALELADLPMLGRHHRGIDDARNISNLALQILPHLESLERNFSIDNSKSS